MKIVYKGLAFISLILVIQLCFVLALLNLINEAEKTAGEQAQAKLIVGHTNHLIHTYYDAANTLKKYFLSRDADSNEKYEAVLDKVPQEIAWLSKNLKGDPEAKSALKRIEAKSKRISNFLREAKKTADEESIVTAIPMLGDFREKIQPLFDGLVVDADQLIKKQEKILENNPARQAEERKQLRQILYYGIAANVVVAIFLALYFLKSIVHRVDILMENTRRLSVGKELKPVMRASDEIGQLDKTFHRMADQLSEARRKERAILDNALDVICALDKNCRFQEVSPASIELWGYEEEFLLGHRLQEFIAEDTLAYAEEMFERARQSSLDSPFESKVRKSDGDYIDTLWSVQWNEEDSTFYCVAHDISDRKRAEELLRASEERLRRLIDSLPVGVILATDDEVIEYANERTGDIFLFDREAICDRPLNDLFSDSLKSLDTLSEGALEEVTGLRKAINPFPAEVSAVRYVSSEGVKFLVVVLDVTEKFELIKLRRSFVSMVSHELRTPLTSIQSFLGMLNMGVYGELPDQVLKLGASAERSTNQLIRLINELLDVEKMEQGKLEMRIASTSVQEIVGDALEFTGPYLDKYDIQLEEDLDSGEIALDADRERLSQVLINLVSNAAKFSPRGATVKLTASFVGKSARFEVIDRGRGIPAEHCQAIFERFHQVEESDSSEKGGSGLGLAICKLIVEAHGGEIGVQSEPGEGSTFWFSIPLKSA